MYLFITVGLSFLGLSSTETAAVSILDSARTVLIYLGIPFAAGYVSRFLILRWKGREWFDTKFVPVISPLTLIALLFTIVIMFSLKGTSILESPADVLRVAVPFVVYFALIWLVTFYAARTLGAPYEDSVATAFSAASNDFELAIAVAIAVFGIHSGQAFAAVIGPLIEVPVMVLLVRLSMKLKYQTVSNGGSP